MNRPHIIKALILGSCIICIFIIALIISISIGDNSDFATHKIDLGPNPNYKINLRNRPLNKMELNELRITGNSLLHDQTLITPLLNGKEVSLDKSNYFYRIKTIIRGDTLEGYISDKFNKKNTLKPIDKLSILKRALHYLKDSKN